MTGPPRDAAGNAMKCPACDTEVRPTSMTAAGITYQCTCGRTTLTYLSEGTLGVVRDSVLTDPEPYADIPGAGQRGCG